MRMKAFFWEGTVWVLNLMMGAVVTVATLVAGTVVGIPYAIHRLARYLISLGRKGGVQL